MVNEDEDLEKYLSNSLNIFIKNPENFVQSMLNIKFIYELDFFIK